MKISQVGIEVPDDCGDFCPVFRRYGYRYPLQQQGDNCYRCPIMNCRATEDGTRLMEPSHYRADLAESYTRWWAGNKPKPIQTQQEEPKEIKGKST